MHVSKKTADFIAAKRRQKGLTQQQVAEKLNVTFQAVSKWESAAAYPNTELLLPLADILGTTADDILRGKESLKHALSYGEAGVDVNYTDSLKKEMAGLISSKDPRVLNGVGPFASLYDFDFKDIRRPVLVLKAEEPGSKQKIAMECGFVESICHDMINHLVNDIIVMGARPLAVLDTIVCSVAEKETIKAIIKGISDACAQNGCSLVGGETSVQPNVVERGTYILSATIAGVADRENIIDGSAIGEGNILLAAASNGPHTNGYSLIRLLMQEMPQLKNEKIGGETFLNAVMKPHTPYYKAVKDLTEAKKITGMAHITGGGIEGNLKRIIPEGLSARIDLAKIKIPDIFTFIKGNGNIADAEMLGTFNCGVGLIIAVSPQNADFVKRHVLRFYDCYEIGEVAGGAGDGKVVFQNCLNWRKN
ncbi:MAG: phosphoribosylformylglycinamidine cyclo-ligase [Clostridiales bacterium]|jgi:phosphoribosylformylglycinamidine cyclo-ligase|nr:phosphoribosylformylglycinamidine cyclo-ligase [Clostridiales bacterium]